MTSPERLPDDDAASHPQTDALVPSRIAREREIIARANADIDAGLGVEWDAVKAWLLELDHDDAAGQPATHPYAP